MIGDDKRAEAPENTPDGALRDLIDGSGDCVYEMDIHSAHC